jgi:hypothetical protein
VREWRLQFTSTSTSTATATAEDEILTSCLDRLELAIGETGCLSRHGSYLWHRFGILKVVPGSPGYHQEYQSGWNSKNHCGPRKRWKPLISLNFMHKKRRLWTSLDDEVVGRGNLNTFSKTLIYKINIGFYF